MGIPTDEELQLALTEAARMREQGEDPCHLAKVLLNHNYRVEKLEKVMHAAELYMHSGQAGHEHAELVRAIKVAKSASSNTTDSSEPNFGL